jgi:hypothetical protein
MLDIFRGPSPEEQVRSESRIVLDVDYMDGIIQPDDYQEKLKKLIEVEADLGAQRVSISEQLIFYPIKHLLAAARERIPQTRTHIGSESVIFSESTADQPPLK